MKKFFFLLTMFASIAASAQNMQITPISATYTSSPVIQFEVSWKGARTYRHNIKVWVFVNYRKIENNAPAGNWTRAAITATPAVNSTPTSTTATLVPGNDKGFWLNGVDGDYSATLTVPLTLAAGVAQFNWCAYATDYPPNVVVHSTSSYTLRGSPPFVINGGTLPVNQTTYSGTITSFTDATDAPGKFPASLNQPPNEMGCVAGLVENRNGVCVEPSAVGCTNNTLDLGTVSFTAGDPVQIVGNGVSQIWSRPVTATGCQKETYNGGTLDNADADCRKNTNYAGDYFSGCAAFRYHAQLCPPPWRVPSALDVINLTSAYGCSAAGNSEACVRKFVDMWKADFRGELNATNGLTFGNRVGSIWAIVQRTSKIDAAHYNMGVLRWTNEVNSTHGTKLPWWYNAEAIIGLPQGTIVRCVRDN
ncbi:MAG: hypothetical protein LBF81_03780 [Prevotellaceae bacterium]|jgi:hypothetical protein|nr:hypothetical protein [Prevotellaceae bacterium]